MTQYEKYLKVLQTDFRPATRVDFLNPDGTVAYSITDDVIQDGSSINVSFQNGKVGCCRTGTIVVDNWRRLYETKLNKLWIGQMVRIYQGVYLDSNTTYMIPQGTFYVNNPQESYYPSNKTVTIQLVDKWAGLDGTVHGNIGSIFKLEQGINLFTAINGILQMDKGNGFQVDNIPPLFDSTYLTKEYDMGGVTYNYLECPYEAKISKNYGSVLSEINTMLISNMYYDPMGRLMVEYANADIDISRKQSLYDFSTSDPSLIGMKITENISGVYNHVIVNGGVLNGHKATGTATDNSAGSPFSVSRIGLKIAPPEEQSKYYSDTHCTELAEFKLKEYQKTYSTISIECSPIYHIRENQLVTMFRDGIDQTKIPCLVNSFNLPLGVGTMKIEASIISHGN